jgi:hypothetical protein
VSVQQAFTHCTGAAPPTVSAWVSNRGDARIPAPDGSGWDAWTEMPLATADGVNWTTTLPRMPVPSMYRYFTVVTSADGAESVASHGELDQGVNSFWIGDRAPLWCDDLETGAAGFSHGAIIPWQSLTGIADEWSVGSPIGGGTFDPDVSASGSMHWNTALDADYQPNNAEHLLSPSVNINTEGRMRLFTYQRWLSVEDGLYDRAQVVITDGATFTPIWSNAATPAGTTALVDTDWTTVDHDLTPWLSPEGVAATPLNFGFSLQTDAGLEFGGWGLDDLCVVELADPPDHYRRVDLTAAWTDSGEAEVGEVTLGWHTPWIHPLAGTVLLRQEGRAPESLDDGVIVHLDLSPVYGEEHTAVDTLPGLDRGTSWTYALFAWGRDDADAYTVAVDGQNARTLSFELRDTAVPVDTSEDTSLPEDTGTPKDPPPDDTGKPSDPECGCASGTSPAAALAVGAALLLVRRRRR